MTDRKATKTFEERESGIKNILAKFFQKVRLVIKFIFELIGNLLDAFVYGCGNVISLLASPRTLAAIAFVVFMITIGFTGYQWYQIGVGLLTPIFNNAGLAGTSGVLIGLGINLFQMAPNLWKINKNYAQAYKNMSIDNPNGEVDPELDKNSKSANLSKIIPKWLVSDHYQMRAWRRKSFFAEAFIQGLYVFVGGGFNIIGIVLAALTLYVPEKMLEIISGIINHVIHVNQEVEKQAEKEVAQNVGGF